MGTWVRLVQSKTGGVSHLNGAYKVLPSALGERLKPIVDKLIESQIWQIYNPKEHDRKIDTHHMYSNSYSWQHERTYARVWHPQKTYLAKKTDSE